MKITFDPAKRAATLANRGLDFADAAKIFAGDHATWESDQSEGDDVRSITAGRLEGRMVVFVWIFRNQDCHVISMRHCHAKEERKIRKRFGL
jgi:uncharacterized protein